MKNKSNYFSLTNDYVFKRIFGHVGNEEITTNLLESIFDCPIANIDLDKNTFLEKDIASDKLGILDIKAILNDSIPCNIEMQIIPYSYLIKRILYYWAKLYTSTIKKGETYEKLKKTVGVWLIDFNLSELNSTFEEISAFHTKWHIREDEFQKHILSDVFEIHIISLKSLEKSIELGYNTNEKDLINWIKFIKNPNLKEDSVMENEYIKKAKTKYDELEEDEHERYLAESRMDYVLQLNSCKLDGYEKGKKEQKIEIAKKLLKKNMDIQTIIELTELSEEEIEKLK